MRLTLYQVDMAIAALRAVQKLEGPADGVLRNFFRENHKLGVNERAFIADTVFGVLRHFFSLNYITSTTTPRSLFLAYLVKFRGINLRELMPYISEAEIKQLVKIKAVKSGFIATSHSVRASRVADRKNAGKNARYGYSCFRPLVTTVGTT